MMLWNGDAAEGKFLQRPLAALLAGIIMKRKINLDELRKVEASTVIPLAQHASDVVQAIIKVKHADYVPDCVRLRATMSPFIFTADLQHGDLASLESDPKVESVSVSKKLKSAE